jgi:hypothetical protein
MTGAWGHSGEGRGPKKASRHILRHLVLHHSGRAKKGPTAVRVFSRVAGSRPALLLCWDAMLLPHSVGKCPRCMLERSREEGPTCCAAPALQLHPVCGGAALPPHRSRRQPGPARHRHLAAQVRRVVHPPLHARRQGQLALQARAGGWVPRHCTGPPLRLAGHGCCALAQPRSCSFCCCWRAWWAGLVPMCRLPAQGSVAEEGAWLPSGETGHSQHGVNNGLPGASITLPLPTPQVG